MPLDSGVQLKGMYLERARIFSLILAVFQDPESWRMKIGQGEGGIVNRWLMINELL